MNDPMARRVSAAAAAGWWTMLIGLIWLMVGWAVVLVVLYSKPGWVLSLLGPREMATWKELRSLYLGGYTVIKIVLWTLLFVVIWLTLWSRRLRRVALSGK